MKKRLLLSFVLLLVTFNISGESLYDAIDQFEISYLDWISGEWGSGRTIIKLQSLGSQLDQQPDGWEKFYWQAKISLAIGTIYYEDGQTTLSLSALEESRDLARHALEKEGFSDGWRVLSDAGSIILLQKGLAYFVANSSKIQEEAEKAIILNPGNARAVLIVARGMVNLPPVLGGNIKKGMAVLEALAERRDLNDLDRYFIEMALGDAYVTAGEDDMARKTFESVLKTYPRNRWAYTRIQNL